MQLESWSTRRAIRFLFRFFLPPGRQMDCFVSILDSIRKLRRCPHIRNPKLFNDHLLKLRADGSLYDPLRQFVTDKEYVKHYVAATIGTAHTIPTISVFRDLEELGKMHLTQFPCVIKPTHMSGRILICANEGKVDTALVEKWLREDYYRISREANYRFLQHKIIVEEFFSKDGILPPDDYKIFCFHGRPRIIQVDSGRFRNHTRNLYDTRWNRLPFTIQYPGRSQNDPKPSCLSLMLEIASILSSPFSSIRVDLYTHSGQVKVGELTNCHGGGTELFNPPKSEQWFGALFTTDSAERIE